MSENQFSEMTSTGWFGRIGESIKGVLFGVIMIVISFPVLFLNEKGSVKAAKTLDEGAKSVITVSIEKSDPSHDGKLVYLTGKAVTKELLTDPDFGVKSEALKLRRKVEFYQWVEKKESTTKKKLGGGQEKTTTYNYEKKWSDKYEDSTDFKHPEGHENPKPELQTENWAAQPITVGEFKLSTTLVGQIENFIPLPVGAEAAPLEKTKIAGKTLRREGSGFYLGDSQSNSLAIGDLRITHEVALPGEVSVIAAQTGSDLTAYHTEAGGNIELLETGKHPASEMFTTAQKKNTIMTWVVRLLGTILMTVGFVLLLRPLSVLADVLPIAGDIVGFGTGLVAIVLSVSISLAVIAFAWLFYRPMLGIPLVVMSVAGIIYLMRKLSAQRELMASQ